MLTKLVDVLGWNHPSHEFTQDLAKVLQDETISIAQTKLSVATLPLAPLNRKALMHPAVVRALMFGSVDDTRVIVDDVLRNSAFYAEDQNLTARNYEPDQVSEKYFVVTSYHMRHTNEEMESIQGKLDGALAILRTQLPSAFTFVANLTSEVRAIKDTEPGSGGDSSSTGDWFGRTIIRNAHLPEVDEVLLCEFLIHEAIHHALNIIEIKDPLTKHPDFSAMQACSRWSGNFISLHSYLHACLVWHGLYQFYKKVEGTDAPSRKMIREKIRYTSFGFRFNRGMTSQFYSADQKIHPDFLSTLEKIQNQHFFESSIPKAGSRLADFIRDAVQ